MLIDQRAKLSRPRLQHISMSAPMNGLDLASPISAPRNGTALRLDNLVCRTDGIHTRDGYAVAYNAGGWVRAFLPYENQLFVATDDQITFMGSPAATGFLGGDWMSAVIANPGGTHMVAVNGTDSLLHYDGLDWDAATVENVDTTRLIAVVNHQRRLFFADNESLKLWYLKINAFAGPAYPIPLDAHFCKGGHVEAIASMSVDGGRSTNDLLAVITTQGELALFAGTDPSRAETWSIIGVFDVGVPAGKRAFCQLGSGLAVITDWGVLSVPDILRRKQSDQPINSLSYMIDTLVIEPSQMIDSPSAKLTLLHDGSRQFIMSDTGAWSRWSVPSTVWCEHNGALWFGQHDGNVCRYEGTTDAGEPIASHAVASYSQYGTSNRKIWKRARLMIDKPAAYQPVVSMFCDDENLAAAESTNIAQAGDTVANLGTWQGLGRNGVTGALSVAMKSETKLIWTGYQLAYTMGGARAR